MLRNVYLVLGLRRKLISTVRLLTNHTTYKTSGTSSVCHDRNNDALFIHRVSNSMLLLNTITAPSTTVSALASVAAVVTVAAVLSSSIPLKSVDTDTNWHRQLAHINSMQSVVPQSVVPSATSTFRPCPLALMIHPRLEIAARCDFKRFSSCRDALPNPLAQC